MAELTTFENVVAQYDGAILESARSRVEGYIRRAERSLAGLVGDLGTYHPDLVRDIVVDAVIRVYDNPKGYRSESDGDYSYTLIRGSDGFWWPSDWRVLFGKPAGGARTVRVPLSPGWGPWSARGGCR